MKKINCLVGAIALSCLLFTACKKDIKADLESDPPSQSATTGTATSDAFPITNAHPVPGISKPQEAYSFLTQQLLRQVAPTPCNSATPLISWLSEQVADWTPAIRSAAFGYALMYIPGDYAYLFENSSAGQTFGANGQYNQIMAKTFKDLKRFWNMEAVGIVLAAMHGTTLLDKVKVSNTIRAYGYAQADADYFANFIYNLVTTTPQYRNGNHPYFTFNAFASTPQVLSDFPFGVLPYKIVMGDGIMEGYAAIGFDDVAPQAVLAHEFAHQVQFDINVTFQNTSEATRRTELMADALAAYYLAHSRGASMQWKRVKQFLQVFFNIGDCSFNSTGHHGTPTQRMAAAEWAYSVINNAANQGHILSPAAFVALFDAQLPTLVLQ